MKLLAKKGVEKIQEEHRLANTEGNNQIQVLEFTNNEQQQEILRLNEEIDVLIANRHVTRHGCFNNMLFHQKEQ